MFWNKKKDRKPKVLDDEETAVIYKYIEENSPAFLTLKELNSRFFPNYQFLKTLQMNTDSRELLESCKNLKGWINEFEKNGNILEQRENVVSFCNAFCANHSKESLRKELSEKELYLSRLPDYLDAYEAHVTPAIKKENPDEFFDEKEYFERLKTTLDFNKVSETSINGFGILNVDYVSELGGFKKTAKMIIPDIKKWYTFVLAFATE